MGPPSRLRHSSYLPTFAHGSGDCTAAGRFRECESGPGRSWTKGNGLVIPTLGAADWLRSAYTPVSPMARAQNSATMRSSGRLAVRPKFSSDLQLICLPTMSIWGVKDNHWYYMDRIDASATS